MTGTSPIRQLLDELLDFLEEPELLELLD